MDVITALMDHGGGTLEAFAKLVSEALCVPLDKVNISPAGTRTTVYDVVTHATRGVYAGGGAVMKATQKVREDLLETAARFLNVQPEALAIRKDEALGQGVVYAPAIPDRKMTIGEIATRCWTESWKTIASVESYRPVNCPPAYVSVFVEVEVDTWTGRCARCAQWWAAIAAPSSIRTWRRPVGRRPSKGAGFALLEDNEWDAQGHCAPKATWWMPRSPASAKARAWRASPPILPIPMNRPGRLARKASAKRRRTRWRRPMPTPSTMPSASAFTSCPLRRRKSWPR